MGKSEIGLLQTQRRNFRGEMCRNLATFVLATLNVTVFFEIIHTHTETKVVHTASMLCLFHYITVTDIGKRSMFLILIGILLNKIPLIIKLLDSNYLVQ